MTGGVDVALVQRTIRETLANAARNVPQITVRPATVVEHAFSSTVAAVVDGDSAATEMVNATGETLAPGDRVLAQFVPPHAVFAVGLIHTSPTRWGAGEVAYDVDTSNSGAVTAHVWCDVTLPYPMIAGRTYKITGKFTAAQSAGGDGWDCKVINGTGGGAAQVDRTTIRRSNGTGSETTEWSVRHVAAGGENYFYLRFDRRDGAGTLAVFGATIASSILVEDLGVSGTLLASP